MSTSTINALSKAIARKTNKKGNNSKSGKNPAFYNRQAKLFMDEMLGHDNPEVRIAAAQSPYVASTKLVAALRGESEVEVMAVILRNPRLPITAIEEFVQDEERANLLSEDTELIEHLSSRVNPTGNNAADDSTDDEE